MSSRARLDRPSCSYLWRGPLFVLYSFDSHLASSFFCSRYHLCLSALTGLPHACHLKPGSRWSAMVTDFDEVAPGCASCKTNTPLLRLTRGHVLNVRVEPNTTLFLSTIAVTDKGHLTSASMNLLHAAFPASSDNSNFAPPSTRMALPLAAACFTSFFKIDPSAPHRFTLGGLSRLLYSCISSSSCFARVSPSLFCAIVTDSVN